MAVYINSASCLSAQPTLSGNPFEGLQAITDKIIIHAIEPSYKEFIPAGMIRRMSKTVKMSSVASHYALEQAELQNPDAIIVGTGMGCSQDSEKFLRNVIDNNEEFLTPTHFIQSTHNTVSGQIALGLGCHGYNFTYVNTSSSLEFSMLDAKLQLENHEASHILVGGSDEQTARTMELYQLNNTIKKETNLPANYLNSTTEGVLWGEGSAFFVLENQKKNNSLANIKAIEIINHISKEEVSSFIENFLAKNQLTPSDIDAIILGYSADKDSDEYYSTISPQFETSSQLYYKHLSGEYNTASGFSLFMACQILKRQEIPSIMQINQVEKKTIKNILLYNHLLGDDHSLVLLQQP